MKYGIIPLTIVPGRAEATSKSEMITQFLFGEHFEVLEETPKWLYVKSVHDQYECWIERDQAREISEAEYNELANGKHALTLDLTGMAVSKATGAQTKVVLSSLLPFYNEGSFRIGDEEFEYKGNAALDPLPLNEETLNPLLNLYTNTPYLWGGRSPFGIDCSGFVGCMMRLCGIWLPRDAYQQAEHGESVSFAGEAQFGDLAFFDNEEEHINHVGWVLPQGKILHAGPMVRVDQLDHQGIFNVEKGEYSHKLRIIRRLNQ